MSEWISVKDKFPDCDSIQYIGDVTRITQPPREYLCDKYRIIEAGFMHPECELWMPLPEPPK